MNNDNFKDYYKILQVDRNAVQEVIAKAYKSLAKKYHPDLNLNNLDEANEKMRIINEAYNTLNNIASRTKYNLIYDSYMKNNISYSSANDNNLQRTYNSHMTEKGEKEDTKKEYIKKSSLLKFKKRNIVIAGIIAVLFTCMLAEEIFNSRDYYRIDRPQKGIMYKHKANR